MHTRNDIYLHTLTTLARKTTISTYSMYMCVHLDLKFPALEVKNKTIELTAAQRAVRRMYPVRYNRMPSQTLMDYKLSFRHAVSTHRRKIYRHTVTVFSDKVTV